RRSRIIPKSFARIATSCIGCDCMRVGKITTMERVAQHSDVAMVAFSRAATRTPACDEYVCWSRMQAEAGQTLESIVARKERERRAGNGVFFWGVGNAPASMSRDLARAEIPVRVIFSIMKSRPKRIDSNPSKVVVWRRYVDANGVARDLPPHAMVTSRAHSS